MIMKAFLLYLYFFLSALAAFSQEPKLNVEGELEIDHITYFKQLENKINGRNQGLVFLKLSSQLNSTASFCSSLEFRDDLSNNTRNRAYLNEAFIDLTFDDMDFRIGKQIYNWGKADGINPVDALNPTDFSDILDTDDETIGLLSLNATYYFKNFSLQGIFIPEFTSSVLPL